MVINTLQYDARYIQRQVTKNVQEILEISAVCKTLLRGTFCVPVVLHLAEKLSFMSNEGILVIVCHVQLSDILSQNLQSVYPNIAYIYGIKVV